MRHRILIALLALLVVGITGSRADVRMPQPPEPPWGDPPPQPQRLLRQPCVGPLTIVVSAGKNPATRLRLSGSSLKELRAELPRDNGRHYAGGWTTSSLVMAGTALSLGFVFGGLWLVRGRPGRRVVLGLGLAVGLCASVGGCILLGTSKEVAKPGEEYLQELDCQPEGKLTGSLYLEVDDKAEDNRLIIHRKELEQFLDHALQAPPVEVIPGTAPPAAQP